MLSIVDLIDAGTMTSDLVAYSLASIIDGASFMVGAMPGGAGKTTVMGALLNFVPGYVQLVAAENISVVERGTAKQNPRFCYICHEIGQGRYYAYLWGNALRNYFDLPNTGHMLATNLHADTYSDAFEQVCQKNAVSPAAFRRMNLIFFLDVSGNGFHTSRRISEVWESDGQCEHQKIFDAASSTPLIESSRLVFPRNFTRAREIIDQLITSGARTIQEVRSKLLSESSN